MTELLMPEREFVIWVPGRPAPQGSKRHGAAGQMREQSVYLPAWRIAVKRAAYEWYRAMEVKPGDLPLFVGPVGFAGTFWLPAGRRADAPPDLDKLLRATWDALSQARVWEDDGRVVLIEHTDKRQAGPKDATGAELRVWGAGGE